jgi:hypothetical protein
MKKLTIIAFAAALLAACSKDSLETNPSASSTNLGAAKVSVARPFTANFFATADANASIPPTSCSGDLPGFSAPDFLISGIATHLGQMNAAVSRLHHVGCDLSFATMLLTTNVTVDLVASDGDVVHCSGDDVVNVASLLMQTGTTGSITGTWNIIGGTGRFEGATGIITIDGVVDFAANSFTCVSTGSIVF